ncbi:MAG TPA: hypothetical protein VK638_16905 [Edaphobacter sp.]|nr:hypothetical protein [Edaphobacter sp.]
MYALILLVLYDITAGAVVIGFDSARPGTMPAGWTAHLTHAGTPSRWEVVLDDSAPSRPSLFAQLSTDQTAGRFPLVIENPSFLNGSVAVLFKPVAGVVDQAAGIVWRYRNPENYYIVRANALENNVVLYKVVGGLRTSIPPKGLPSRSYGVQYSIAKRQGARCR